MLVQLSILFSYQRLKLFATAFFDCYCQQFTHYRACTPSFRDNWAKLDVLVNGGLLGICMWELYLRTAGTASVKGNALEALGVELQQVVPAALSGSYWPVTVLGCMAAVQVLRCSQQQQL